MTSSYCLLYKTSNRLCVSHAISTNCLLFIDGVQNKNVFPITKLIDEIEIDEIVHKTFLDARINFMTNISQDTFLYKKLKKLLPSTLKIIKDLSFEELDMSRRTLVDCLIGKNIKFDTILHERRVFQYLDQDEISANLFPYLHLIHSTKIQQIDWLKQLVKS
mgnify:CR=1 FL=1|jgi:hypothetical protein